MPNGLRLKHVTFSFLVSLVLCFAVVFSASASPGPLNSHQAHPKQAPHSGSAIATVKASSKTPASPAQSTLSPKPSHVSASKVEAPQKLSPEKIPAETTRENPLLEEARPLNEAVKPVTSPERESTLWRIYSVFLIALLVLIVGLVLARRLGLIPASANDRLSLATQAPKRHSGASSNSASGLGFWLSSLMAPSSSVNPEPDDRDFYRPVITHRQKLGAGRELLTLHMAGQWLLLGVTPSQIQFIANLTHEVAHTEPSKLDDPQLAGLYEKYVEPIAAQGRRVSRRDNDIDVEDASQLAEAFRRELSAREGVLVTNNRSHGHDVHDHAASRSPEGEDSPEIHYNPSQERARHGQNRVPYLGEKTVQAEESDEIELPDFEDVFDPASPTLIKLRPSAPPYAGAFGGRLKEAANHPRPTSLQPRTSSVESTLQTMAESPGPLPAHPSKPSPDYLV
jgi:Flagellar biosynthesis protein, FliO